MGFEFSLFQFLNNLVGHSGFLDWFIVFLGQYFPYFLVAGIAWLLAKETNWKQRFYYFSFLTLAVILSRGLITEIIRFFYSRVRPFAELGFDPLIEHAATSSFPSGHAATYFALAFVILLAAVPEVAEPPIMPVTVLVILV